MGKVTLRYGLSFDVEVELRDDEDPFERAAFEEREFARYPERYLGDLPDEAKFTVEP